MNDKKHLQRCDDWWRVFARCTCDDPGLPVSSPAVCPERG